MQKTDFGCDWDAKGPISDWTDWMRLGTKRTHLGWDWDAKEAISDAIGMQKDRSRMGLGAKGGWDWDMKGSIRIGMQKDRFRDAPGPISDGVGMQEDRFRMGFGCKRTDSSFESLVYGISNELLPEFIAQLEGTRQQCA